MTKRKRHLRSAKSLFVMTFSLLLCLTILPVGAHAAERPLSVSGTVYEFEENAHYEFSGAKASTKQDAFGSLNILGNATCTGNQGAYLAYTVVSGNLSFSYTFDLARLTVDETEWHLISDKSKKVNDFELDKSIQSGSVIVQSSSDGKTWITDTVITDAFTENSALSNAIYETKDIQLVNGCYYRIIVAYKIQRQTGEGKILFVSTKETEAKKVAEVYEFYAVSSEIAQSSTAINTSPKMILGQQPSKVKTDSGYSEKQSLDKDDPHFGWDLGRFVVNGYTREVDGRGAPVFLKNVGDKVTLWFSLQQDINCLNGNDALTVAEDNNGYDQHFGIPQTNFKRGTLIIQFTDHEGNKHDPIVYTDFLAANAIPGADTRVQLFEEGDYEVSLDYEIKNNPRQLGPISIVPTYTNYKIAFAFSIRNGNCMVFPFDIASGAELADKSMAANGFRLDLAMSRYLNIDIVQSTLLPNSETGLLAEDIRANRPAKDGAEYKDEGVYTFTVTNQYTNERTTKTIYVGTNKYLLALSKYRLTVEDLNERISQGVIIDDDGNIIDPMGEPEPEPTPEPTFEPMPTPEPVNTPAPEPLSTPEAIITDIKVEYFHSMPVSVFYVMLGLSLVVLIGFIATVVKRRKAQVEYIAPVESAVISAIQGKDQLEIGEGQEIDDPPANSDDQ